MHITRHKGRIMLVHNNTPHIQDQYKNDNFANSLPKITDSPRIEPFDMVEKDLRKDPNISSNELRLLMAIQSFSYGSGVCFAKTSTIAEENPWTNEHAIRRMVTSLKKKGYLFTHQIYTSGKKGSSHWYITKTYWHIFHRGLMEKKKYHIAAELESYFGIPPASAKLYLKQYQERENESSTEKSIKSEKRIVSPKMVIAIKTTRYHNDKLSPSAKEKSITSRKTIISQKVRRDHIAENAQSILPTVVVKETNKRIRKAYVAIEEIKEEETPAHASFLDNLVKEMRTSDFTKSQIEVGKEYFKHNKDFLMRKEIKNPIGYVMKMVLKKWAHNHLSRANKQQEEKERFAEVRLRKEKALRTHQAEAFALQEAVKENPSCKLRVDASEFHVSFLNEMGAQILEYQDPYFIKSIDVIYKHYHLMRRSL